MPVLALSMSATFVACGSDDDDPTPNNGGEDVIPPVDDEKVLTNEQQKERLNAIGKQVINLVPASDFEDVLSLGRFIRDNYFDDEPDEVQEWAQTCLDNIAGEFVREETRWYYVYTYTRRTYAASQFLAHIEWKNGAWRVTEENTSDLQFKCPDKNGRMVVGTVTTSGRTKKVYLGQIDRDDDWEYKDGSQYYTEDVDLAYVEVPEQIDVTVTYDGSTLATVTIKTDLSSMSGTDFNLSRDRYGVEVYANLCGYTIKNVRVAGQANTKDGVSAAVTIEKGGKTLLNVNVTGEVDVKGGYYGEDSETEVEVNGGNVTQLYVDILGQLQVKGTCKNIKTFIDTWDKADDSENRTNEMAMKGLAATINDLFTTRLFYDGSSLVQGTMTLAPFYKEGYWSNGRWELKPLITFADGTSYCMTDESYFNKDNFAALTNLFEDLMDDYERLWNRYIR